jgi:murein DD-endopeptidase MepM/ murein hydrolase activator NlpD
VARIFPCSARRRVVAATAACSLMMTMAVIPLAAADDLEDRKQKVQGDISETLHDLDQTSAQLLAATQALDAAQAELDAAEDRLAKTRGELMAAEVLDRQMQAELDKAVERLRVARVELARGLGDVVDQERTLGQIAVQNYQTGDPALLGLSMVLNSRDPAQLTGQLNSVRNVLDKESATLDRLEASRVMLTVKEEEVEAAKAEVAVQRRAAAKNLRRKQALEQQAEEEQDRVANLVSARAEAKDAAAEARSADLRMLRGLQQERDKISTMLEQRAEAARRRAEAAAARAAAAAEAQAGSSKALSSNGFLNLPVDGYITSSYGMRLHPVYKRWTLHDGTDFGAACGTPVRAAAGGRVIAAYYNGGYGNRVIIDNGYHRDVGLGTAYNHLGSYSTFVGERVERGDIIGYVGNTGYSTGCHLHFMVFENGAAVDPMGWL